MPKPHIRSAQTRLSTRRGKRFACLGLVSTLLCANAAADVKYQSLEEIRAAAEQFVRESYADLGTISAVEVDRLDPRLRLVACELPLEAFSPTGQRRLGHTTVGVRCSGAKPWTLYVPARVISRVTVMTTTRALPRGSVLKESDLAPLEREVAALPQGYYRDAKALVGMQLKRAVGPGEILSAAALEAPKAVERGQEVYIVAENASVRVAVKAEALEDGAVGDRIQVRNLSSRRVIQAEVLGKNMVKVPL